MKTHTYESVIIINATLDDSQIEAVIKRVEEIISAESGNIIDVEKWGRKRLAYPIEKSKNGYYVIFRFTAPTEAITKIERMYRLDEAVVRYLTTVMELKDLANFEKVKKDRTLTLEVETNTTDAVKTEIKEEVVEDVETVEVAETVETVEQDVTSEEEAVETDDNNVEEEK